MKFYVGCLGFFVLMISAAFASEPIRIDKAGVNPKTVDFTKGEKAVISFATSGKAFLSILFKDESGNILNQYELGLQEAGKQVFSWDGKMQNGETVKTDVVVYAIEAKSEDGSLIRFDPSSESGGNDLSFPKFSLDKKSGKIEYILPQAGRVRLRAGILEGALLKTILDWQAKEAGKHELMWDGLDKSGEMNLLNNANLNLNLNAFSLPDNAIIVKQIEPSFAAPDSVYHEVKTGRHFHYLHPRSNCHEPKFKIIFSDAVKKDEKGIPLLKGKTAFSVQIDPSDEIDLIRKRFEVMVYFDSNFLFEEEQAVTPATFTLDVSSWAQGYHLLTVNVMSYDDHIGVETVKVKVIA